MIISITEWVQISGYATMQKKETICLLSLPILIIPISDVTLPVTRLLAPSVTAARACTLPLIILLPLVTK